MLFFSKNLRNHERAKGTFKNYLRFWLKMIPEDKIYLYTLANAVKYNGKPNQGAVLGKILAEHPELKVRIKEVGKAIAAAVEKAKKLSVNGQRAFLEKHAPELLDEKHEEQEKKLIDLPNAVYGKVVMRIAPAPSGPLHAGHAYVLSLTSELCRKYNGKLILRLEDTNPENLDPSAYQQIEEDARWLTMNNIHEVVIQSERLEQYYAYAEKVIALGKAYICTCDTELFRKLITEKSACPCRDLSVTEQQTRWKKMFAGYQVGEAVMRVKTDLENPNPALRDWSAFRMNDHPHPHVGLKYRVWPLMNFSVAVDDHLLGITHTVRGKDQKDNEKKQKYLYDYFGWKVPVHLYVGMVNFHGFELSKTETRQKIEAGKYSGWDDIRLPFLRAFRRRGYVPEAFIKIALGMGVAENDKTLSNEEFFKLLDHYNKEVLDPASRRFFVIVDPVEVTIKNAPERDVVVPVHPDFPERGKRTFMTHEKFYFAKNDVNVLQDERVHRLMECLNFTKKGNEYVFDSVHYEAFRDAEKKGMIMHYLPVAKDLISMEIMMPDATVVKGLAESGVEILKVGDVIQAERVGFMRLDAIKQGTYVFWFTHK